MLCAGLNVAVFLLWQLNPQFAARNFLVSSQHIRDGRVYTLLTSGELQLMHECTHTAQAVAADRLMLLHIAAKMHIILAG